MLRRFLSILLALGVAPLGAVRSDTGWLALPWGCTICPRDRIVR